MFHPHACPTKRLGDQLSSDMSSGYGQKTAGNFDGDSIDLSGRASMNLPETPRFRMLSSEYPVSFESYFLPDVIGEACGPIPQEGEYRYSL